LEIEHRLRIPVLGTATIRIDSSQTSNTNLLG